MVTDWGELLQGAVEDVRDKKRHDRAYGSDGEPLSIYLKKRSPHLRRLTRDLQRGEYKVRPVKVDIVQKARVTQSRNVYSPASRDYLACRALSNYLTDHMNVSRFRACNAVMKDLRDATEGKQCGPVLNIDIKDFYNSIKIGPIERILRRQGADITALRIVQGVAEAEIWKDRPNKVGRPAPTGFPHSMMLGNLLLKDFDQWANGLESRGVIFYSRYVDDCLFVFTKSAPLWRVRLVHLQAMSKLRRLGLRAHPMRSGSGKTEVNKSGTKMHYLGYSLNFGSEGLELKIPDFALNREKTKIWNLFRRYFSNGAHPSVLKRSESSRFDELRYKILLSSGGFTYRGRTHGFVFYYGGTSDVASFASLDRFIARLVAKYKLSKYGDVPSYMRAYREGLSRNSFDNIAINYDNFTCNETRKVLVKYFGFDSIDIRKRDCAEVEGIWKAIIRKEMRDTVSSVSAYR